MRLSRALFAAACFALAACQRADTPIERGRAYFNSLGCVQCHRVGHSGGEYGPDLTYIGYRKSEKWLELWIRDPHAWRKQTVMPAFNLPAAVRNDVVAFLLEQKGQAWGDAAPWQGVEDQAKKGEIIFNKVGCVACHGQRGRGGYPNNNVVGGLIPPLDKAFEGFTKEELMTKVRSGVIPSPEDPSGEPPHIRMPEWGKVLKDDEIEAVAEYLISLGQGAPKSKDAW